MQDILIQYLKLDTEMFLSISTISISLIEMFMQLAHFKYISIILEAFW